MKAIRLEIARRNPRALTALAHSVFRRLARGSSPDSPLRDHVFSSIMLGGSLDPLAVRVPRMWKEFLKMREADGPAWERRRKLGLFKALTQTWKEVLFNPAVTFSRMETSGGFMAPFLFNLAMVVCGGSAPGRRLYGDYNRPLRCDNSRCHVQSCEYLAAIPVISFGRWRFDCRQRDALLARKRALHHLGTWSR